MNRYFRMLLFLVGFALVLLAVGVGFVARTVYTSFDAGSVRSQVGQRVRAATGRDLRFAGDVELHWFPWLGVALHQVELGDAPGFGEQPFLRVERVQARTRLASLLTGGLDLDVLVLDGLDLSLRVDEEGRSNWEDLLALAGGEGDDDGAAGGVAQGRGPASLSLQGVRVRDAHVQYEDRRSGRSLRVDSLQVETSRIRPGQPFQLTVGADLVSGDVWSAQVGLQGQVLLSEALDALHLEQARLSASWQGDLPLSPGQAQLDLGLSYDLATSTGAVESGALALSLPQAGGEPLRVGVDWAARLDLRQQRFTLSRCQVNSGDLALGLELEGSQILDEPVLVGSLRVDPFDLRALLARLGSPLPELGDATALRSFGLTSTVQLQQGALTLGPLDLRLDGERWTGRVSVAAEEVTDVAFDLHASALHLDRYLPRESAGSDGGASDPGAPLQGLQLGGALSLEALTVSGLELSDVSLSLTGQEGRIALRPLRFGLYGGQIQGAITANLAGAQPAVAVDASITHLPLQPLLRAADAELALSGDLDLSAHLAFVGGDASAIRGSLEGRLGFSLVDGVYQLSGKKEAGPRPRRFGPRLERIMRRSLGSGFRFQKVELPSSLELRQASGSFVLSAGLASNEDLVIRTDQLDVNGRGTVSLTAETLDYHVAMGLGGLPVITAHLSGPLDDPVVEVERGGQVRARVQGLKQSLGVGETSGLDDSLNDALEETTDSLRQGWRKGVRDVNRLIGR